MNGYEKMCEVYGIKPMSIDEEAVLSEAERQIRVSKMDIIDKISYIRRSLDGIENRTRKIPELTDYTVSTAAKEMADIVSKIELDVINLSQIGIIAI